MTDLSVPEGPRRRRPSAARAAMRKAGVARRIKRLKETSGIEVDVEQMLADLEDERRGRCWWP